MSAAARLQRELKGVNDDSTSGVQAHPVDGFKQILGVLQGPSDTPYSGGSFEVDIQIPDEYPFDPPKCRFITPVWHPNVSSQTGAICLDILKDQWSPALSIKTVLQSLQALMCAPEPDDPQDAVVAGQYKSQRADFDAKAAQWTKKYAMKASDTTAADAPQSSGGGSSAMAAGPPTPAPPADPKLAQLMSMGFPEAAAKQALAQTDGNVETAVMTLLSG